MIFFSGKPPPLSGWGQLKRLPSLGFYQEFSEKRPGLLGRKPNRTLAVNAPDWLDTDEFPFQLRTFNHPDGRLHYVDEGRGPVLLFCHGTPEWSFAYRHLVKALSPQYRCVAVDMLGFGLSDKPAGADYSVAAHARRLAWAVETLKLTNVTLVGGDFGGGLAVDYALRHPANVRGLVLWNTWCWALGDDPHFARPGKLARTAFGRFLYKNLNFPVSVLLPQAFADRRKLTPALHRQYRMPFRRRTDRAAPYELARELLDAGTWWNERWERLDELRATPILLVWGQKDRFVPLRFLDVWRKRLPTARVVELPEAGHFPHEESPGLVVAALSQGLVQVGEAAAVWETEVPLLPAPGA